MSRAAFLAGLRENPADLTAWLVYADWLDERGDPAGAFVRLALDFAAGRVPFEPDFAHTTRLDRLAESTDPGTRESMAIYRSGLPLRLQVCDTHLRGRNRLFGMVGSSSTVVIVAVMAGQLSAGTRLMSEDLAWRPRRPILGVEVFQRVLDRAEAGRGPQVVGLYLVGHHPLPPGTVLVGDPER